MIYDIYPRCKSRIMSSSFAQSTSENLKFYNKYSTNNNFSPLNSSTTKPFSAPLFITKKVLFIKNAFGKFFYD